MGDEVATLRGNSSLVAKGFQRHFTLNGMLAV